MLIVRSPVRISFGGGGTDLPTYFEDFGGATLSTAINKYFYTVLTKRNDGRVQVISADLRALEHWEDIHKIEISGSGLEIPLAVMKDLGTHISANLFMASEIPPGTGLGSSASVCINVLKTLSVYLKKPMSPYELAERAYHIARNVLHNPVGKQDEYAAAFGGLNYITYHQDGNVTVEPVRLEPELLREFQGNLMLFFTGAAHHSWTILKEQEESTHRHHGTSIRSLHLIREMADRMRAALEAGDLRSFGLMLDEGWQAKKLLSKQISNPMIDELYDLGKRSGALGGKITGAGGGGFLLLYCDKQHQAEVRREFAARSIQEMTFEFDFAGARVVVDDPFIDNDERCGVRWSFVPNVPNIGSASTHTQRRS